MTSAPLPATPDLMMMLRRISAGMREAWPSGVFMQFLVIGAMCPRFGALLQAWLFVEERLAGTFASDDRDLVEDGGDDDGGNSGGDNGGDVRSGWISQEGPVWRWRHVTRFGSRLVIPLHWFVERGDIVGLRVRSTRVAAWSWVLVAGRFSDLFFLLGLDAGRNCEVLVPVC